MSVEFRYPNESTNTNTWLPTCSLVIAGSFEDEVTGIAAQLAADNLTLHAEKLSNAFGRYVLRLTGVSPSDKASLKTFAAAVQGAGFAFKDSCGQVSSSYLRVRFAREGFKRSWQPEAGGTYVVTVVLIDAGSES